MLLIIEALLLILSALGQDHRDAVEGKTFPLDMAKNSVDDQYKGCTEKMANLVKTKYLQKETSDSESKFSTAWKRAEKIDMSPRDGLTKDNLIAIYVYTNPAFELYKNFNNAVQKDKKKYKNKKYEWYSLHFLLTDAIQILKKTQKKCFPTFRGTNIQFKKNVQNKKVRFGSFASSSLDRKVAEFFGTKSCFEIHTCEGANLTKYSKHPKEKEVLIPPYEMFKVTAVNTKRDQKDLWCETVYKLESSGTRSDLNCALFKKATKNITKY
ncbi:erythroblast NAD(P)(+)--arginine ADP-ribosyltransferase-like [Ctenopharyngodon idella]|uniref:erythroblast NAD(P)(+)--arginine ADP-ribosyltransferase-like n=1 Tax=Ctenopharyngodon idella TaxID=7959 RepID=UPI002230B103|nr:erythroblast NAD(P)(+)--arginine ADP-ribosyltransferase-like [Ctenopharyngodon idella]XP_051719216.1 erythroblast NAD(P)(+)--arginine ADP-ribosyltransferase-like [Ctenopharyngodon idella]XP_051719217.1 erythroblast NAD(P)(+)--arginine ADP-ribosyltransferase-like [Ctenopharyngodon idella]